MSKSLSKHILLMPRSEYMDICRCQLAFCLICDIYHMSLAVQLLEKRAWATTQLIETFTKGSTKSHAGPDTPHLM